MGGELSKAPSDEAAAPSSPAVNGPKDLTLTAKAELKAYSHTSRHDCWAIANIKAPLYEQASRVPIDAVAVIDVSGSMAGAKIDLVRKTLLFVVTQCKFKGGVTYTLIYQYIHVYIVRAKRVYDLASLCMRAVE